MKTKIVFLTVLILILSALSLAASEAGAPEPLLIRSYDGASIQAAVSKPAGAGPFPAVLFIHGGVGGSTTERMHAFTRGRVPEHFFQRGYVVMSTDYRRYHFGEDEIQDVLAAYHKLESLPYVDSSRIAVIGGSHGGYLAMMVASRIRPRAVVSFAGLADIETMFFDASRFLRRSIVSYEDWREKLLKDYRAEAAGRFQETIRDDSGKPIHVMGTPLQPGRPAYEVALELAFRFGDRRELYRAISPKDNAHKISSPLLYLVGGEDGLRFSGKALVNAVRQRGVVAEYSEHAGMPHGFYWGWGEKPPPQFQEALKVTTAFVEKHIRAEDR
jgi:dipeptidyl aminopeptidase/acylaminoacyl peptidase